MTSVGDVRTKLLVKVYRNVLSICWKFDPDTLVCNIIMDPQVKIRKQTATIRILKDILSQRNLKNITFFNKIVRKGLVYIHQIRDLTTKDKKTGFCMY